MSSTQNTRAVPIRAIIMILISAAIILAAVGVHGFLTRNDDPQAALHAQEEKIKAAATQTAAAEATSPVCLISVARASLEDANDRLAKAGFTVAEKTAAWPRQPAAPRVTTVYYGEGNQDQARTVATALEGSEVQARPQGLAACADAVAVAVVRN